jgi:Zn-dependent M28 family amino/carboxypeptidase
VVLSFLALLICFVPLNAGSKHSGRRLRPDSELAKALDGITPEALRGDLSFLSSDALAGRDTPSPGLEVAAEFIASRFRASGLEGPVNGSYFQVADLTESAKKASQQQHYKLAAGRIVGRNVIGVIRGSDTKLRDTYVIVSAHYDHIGTVDTAQGRTPEKPTDATDRIYNGANDDGSGTVSVIALAEAFSKLKQKPKRSIIFMTFCGEELGLLGSKYYAEHPVIPLKRTIANINLEQIGRTDGDIKKGSASLTGFEYTTLGDLFRRAGLAFGMHVYEDKAGDRYFRASDNLSFARYGIPDTTLCGAFEFPDYHGLKDEWPKINYDSMAVVDHVVGTVLGAVADSQVIPKWEPGVNETDVYRKAAAQLYGSE